MNNGVFHTLPSITHVSNFNARNEAFRINNFFDLCATDFEQFEQVGNIDELKSPRKSSESNLRR